MSMKKIIQQQSWIQDVKKSQLARAAIRMAYGELPNHVKQEIRIAAAVARVDLFDAMACNFAYEVALAAASAKGPNVSTILRSFAHVEAQPVGCTTFAIIDTEDLVDGIFNQKVTFARNLDWPDPQGLLRKHSVVRKVEVPRTWVFDKANLPYTYESVTFPGYSGVLTGFAPQRFAVALNAILTEEAPRWGAAPTFLLRRVLDECVTFEAAVEVLSKTPLITSAMFTVVNANSFAGPENGAVVIERSPTKYAIRRPEQISETRWVLAATNDTRKMDCDNPHRALPGLSETSDSRYDSVLAGAQLGLPVEDILQEAEFGCTIHRASAEVLSAPHLRVW